MSQYDFHRVEIPYREFPASMFTPARADALAEEIARPSTSYWHDVWHRFRRDPLAMIGLAVFSVMVLACIFYPLLTDRTFDGMTPSEGKQAPSWNHLCGTDQLGRDLFVRIMYGARISLAIGVGAAVINLVIGVIYGGLSGYIGGRLDMVMMRIVDIMTSLPSLLYTLLIITVFRELKVDEMVAIMVALCFTSWIGTARVVRNEVLRLKNSEYVMAAKLSGAKTRHLLFRHMVPNAMGPIIVSTAFMVPGAIFSESFLSYLGLGIQKPMSSWGSLAKEGYDYYSRYPWLMIFPLVAISITMLALNFIGDGLRDALDPRLKH